MHQRLAALAIFALLALSIGASTVQAGPVEDALNQVIASENVTLVKNMPEGGSAISIQFSSDTPHMYLSSLKGIHVYEISDPENPQLVGFEPLPHYQNEAMSIGERKNGDKFLLVGSTLAAVSTAGDVDADSRYVIVVEVTDPANPEAVGGTVTDSRTHTVSCLSTQCDYAYTDGRTQGVISIVDLRNFHDPKMAGTFTSVVPQGHDQDVDDAGFLWHVGGQGAVALDVSKPTKPVQLASTNGQAIGGMTEYNGFILHNSARPNAKKFKANSAPSLKNGNVLLATEEDTGEGECGPELGAFSTWHIPYVDAKRYKKDNPQLGPGKGRIAPLDIWYPEDSGVYGAHCSAHYFDYHESGLVAQGWYELGTRIMDVRNPRDIKQVGYFLAPGATETWAAYWVPERDKKGKVTGKNSNIVYTADLVRGVDILRVDMPGKSAARTSEVEVPFVDGWNGLNLAPVSAPSREYGLVCRIPLGR